MRGAWRRTYEEYRDTDLEPESRRRMRTSELASYPRYREGVNGFYIMLSTVQTILTDGEKHLYLYRPWIRTMEPYEGYT